MWPKYVIKQILALLLLAVLAALMIYALWPYSNAFFGALIIFVLFQPLFKWLVNRWHWPRPLAALAVMVLTVVIILIPLSILASALVREIQEALALAQNLAIDWPAWATNFSRWKIDFNLSEQLAGLGNTAGRLAWGAAQAVGAQLITYVIMYFSLFFLLVTDENKLKQAIFAIMPFRQDNTVKLEKEFRRITYAVLITSGLIALIQGTLLGVGFVIFKISGPVLWGLVTAAASFLPLIGTTVVWLPAAALQFIQGNFFVGLGLIGWGLLISSVDNLLRPFIQKRIGRIHPFVSLLGMIIGLSLFGLIGLVIGPLILSYFLLMLKMFKEEYIEN